MKPTPVPWVTDDFVTDLRAQAAQLVEGIGTDHQWVAVGVEDGEGFSAVVALAHPSNAEFIVRAVNKHEALVDALKMAEGAMTHADNPNARPILEHIRKTLTELQS